MNGLLPASATHDCEVRLFCVPHAGGGSAVFHRWRPALPPSFAAIPLCLPGREARFAEKPYQTMSSLVCDVADAMAPLLDRSYVVLGHSMGALVAFELAREIRRRGLRQADLLVAAASRAPHRPASGQSIHNLSDQAFLRELAHR